MSAISLEESRNKIRDPYTKAKTRLKILQKIHKEELASGYKAGKIYTETCNTEHEKVINCYVILLLTIPTITDR